MGTVPVVASTSGAWLVETLSTETLLIETFLIETFLIETRSARIRAFSRERDSSGRRTARTRSSRGDPSSPATVTSSLWALFEDEFCMTETAVPQPTIEQAVLFARVRRMMLIAGLTTIL